MFMNKIKIQQSIIILFMMVAFFSDRVNAAKVKKPALEAKSAVIMEMDSGKVLYNKNAYKKRNQASLTKLMTVTLALESNTPLKKVRISRKLTEDNDSEFSLVSGDVFYLRDLAYGAMLRSSKRCCMALEYSSQKKKGEFVKKMNKTAKRLGCKNTHYVNPHGYPDTRHYSTAYDSALILRYAYSNKYVRKYMSTKTRIVVSLKKKRKYRFVNSNDLLGTKGVIGGKTGNSYLAGTCLAVVYRYKNVDYAVVTLGNSGKTKRKADQKKLYQYIRQRAEKEV